MSFKFEQLEVWRQALDYLDVVYAIAERLPRSEEYNLKSQMVRAATSVSLNIAEGSTGQSNPEQARFLGYAIRSLIETVACQRIIVRRKLVTDSALLDDLDTRAGFLFASLINFRKALKNKLHEHQEPYVVESTNVFDAESPDQFEEGDI